MIKELLTKIKKILSSVFLLYLVLHFWIEIKMNSDSSDSDSDDVKPRPEANRALCALRTRQPNRLVTIRKLPGYQRESSDDEDDYVTGRESPPTVARFKYKRDLVPIKLLLDEPFRRDRPNR